MLIESVFAVANLSCINVISGKHGYIRSCFTILHQFTLLNSSFVCWFWTADMKQTGSVLNLIFSGTQSLSGWQETWGLVCLIKRLSDTCQNWPLQKNIRLQKNNKRLEFLQNPDIWKIRKNKQLIWFPVVQIQIQHLVKFIYKTLQLQVCVLCAMAFVLISLPLELLTTKESPSSLPASH